MLFASYDGTRLSYEDIGEGPPVVCLPGGPGRAAAYLEDLGGLGAQRRLVLVDLRGSGRSQFPDDPATLAFPRQADDVEALRGHLGLDRVVLLAHSAGTLVAQAYAAAHPDQVAALVLVTPPGQLHGSDRTDVAEIRARRSAEPWYDEAAAAEADMAHAPPPMRAELERAQRPFFYGRWDDRVREHAYSADRQTSPRAAMGFRPSEGFDRAALEEALGRLDAPVLLVGGELDGLTGVAAVHTVAGWFPQAEVVVLPGAGHFPWVDAPEAFRDAVAGFLARAGA